MSEPNKVLCKYCSMPFTEGSCPAPTSQFSDLRDEGDAPGMCAPVEPKCVHDRSMRRHCPMCPGHGADREVFVPPHESLTTRRILAEVDKRHGEWMNICSKRDYRFSDAATAAAELAVLAVWIRNPDG